MTKLATLAVERKPDARSQPPGTPPPLESDGKILAAFEKLVRQIANESSSARAKGPILEIESEGKTYSLFCRVTPPVPALAGLSPREFEIVRMIAHGLPNKAIAAALSISEWTVGTHLRRIFAKFGVSSRAAMVARWLELQPDVEALGLTGIK
jgi:DNA-binding CsgD family transcriptional regulator